MHNMQLHLIFLSYNYEFVGFFSSRHFKASPKTMYHALFFVEIVQGIKNEGDIHLNGAFLVDHRSDFFGVIHQKISVQWSLHLVGLR